MTKHNNSQILQNDMGQMKDIFAPQGAASTFLLTNARLILAQDVVRASLKIVDGKIAEIIHGDVSSADAIDCNGDFVSAGLIELHTDNLERHLQPRPGVFWPQDAAIIAHDRELAGVGITTVFDALRVGSISSDNGVSYDKYARSVASAIQEMRAKNLLQIRHGLHLRAEICTDTVLDELAEFSHDDQVGIISLMDHTPGQRQFRDISKMEEYLAGKYGMSREQMDAHFEHRYALSEKYSVVNDKRVVELGQDLRAVLASHDDTTVSDVLASSTKGVCIAEFPTTLEAAQASCDAGISVMMGAPNILRGGSHSANIAAQDLADAGLLNILSSDYAPSSLLMAAVLLGLESGDMAHGLHTVTQAPAKAVGLQDRGQILPGLNADLIQFSVHGRYPIVSAVWVGGKRIA